MNVPVHILIFYIVSLVRKVVYIAFLTKLSINWDI